MAAQGKEMSFLEHLEELRWTLVRSAFALVAWWLPAGSWERFAGSLGAAALGAALLALRYQRDFRNFFAARRVEVSA